VASQISNMEKNAGSGHLKFHKTNAPCTGKARQQSLSIFCIYEQDHLEKENGG